MASLESLPPDQRAVLQLVLQRGRSYDEIGQILSIDRAVVRQRALAAFDALGPRTRVDPERRALVTDYLLGQLPEAVAQETRNRLTHSASERAWARVLASELAPLASQRLPEIPTDDGAGAGAEQEKPRAPVAPEPVAQPARTDMSDGRRSSRLGGAIVLGVGVLVAVIVVVIVLASGGGTKRTKSTANAATSSTAATTATSTAPTQVVAQVNLNSPSGTKAPAGVAQVVKQGTTTAIVIVASGVAANTKHDAYAVWLFNPGGQSRILGFVNPGVGTNGRLQTAGALPSDAAQFTQLLVTRETQGNPKSPGTIILQGSLKLS